ncbi:heme-binding domain-containing protein [Hydrogenimonas sp.]
MGWRKKTLISLVALGLVIQFVPYGKDHENPAVLGEPRWDSLKTRELFMLSCGDCHSHETKWPWYSNIAPISWIVMHDVEEGREHFNVSMWGHQKKNEGNEAAKEVRKGEMPLWPYLLMHPEARLNDNEKKMLIEGLVRTFGEKQEHD